MQAAADTGSERRIFLGVHFGILLFFVKALVFYALLMLPGVLLTEFVFIRMPAGVVDACSMAWRVLPMVGFAYMFRNFYRASFGNTHER